MAVGAPGPTGGAGFRERGSRDAGDAAITRPDVRHRERRGATAALLVGGAHPPFLAAVSILRRRDTLLVGAPTGLTLEGVDGSGRMLSIPREVVRWTSSEPRIAEVTADGVVLGRQPGSVVITGSAGGWRQTAVRFEIRAQHTDTLLFEEWTPTWTGRWTSWGTPLPRVVTHGGGHVSHTLLPNGDGEYNSGVVSRSTFDARQGLAVEVELRTPITQAKWQFVNLSILTPGPMSPSGPVGLGCGLRYPHGEGSDRGQTLAGIPVESAIRAGRWYTVRMQLFPDGSCGIALNGKAIRHDPLIRVQPQQMQVVLSGQTVGSQLLFGVVRVITGVPTGVDWGDITR